MNWERFKQLFIWDDKLGFGLDVSRINFNEKFFEQMEEKISTALNNMSRIESGEIANPDEKRMVGHFWLRNPNLAPEKEISKDILETIQKIKSFSEKILSGNIQGQSGKFKHVLCIGIGGSALGPQFVSQTLGKKNLKMWFLDNTDPDGMNYVLNQIISELGQTLVIVISKSGSTPEPRNSMLTVKRCFEIKNINFSNQFVAITQSGSELDSLAKKEKWLETFPMWDWIGGRMSELAAVGLLPAQLEGIEIDELLAGACEMDKLTRLQDFKRNPALLLALSWYSTGNGKGEKAMVVLPYKDRLSLIGKYLQQLIMESIGKSHDLNGEIVNQGLSVYGNKGSTDQHSFVQQLRDGKNDFFATFIEVLKDKSENFSFLEEKISENFDETNDIPYEIEVEPGIKNGDYLTGFFLGTRESLSDANRESLTITIRECSAFSVGMLIALFERAMGFYASFIKINAYNQPGVEAGKKAARKVLDLQKLITNCLSNEPLNIEQIAKKIRATGSEEWIFKILEHMVHNSTKIKKIINGSFDSNTYSLL